MRESQMWNLLLDSMQNKNEDGSTTQEEEDGLSDNFDYNQGYYIKEGEDAQTQGICLSCELLLSIAIST